MASSHVVTGDETGLLKLADPDANATLRVDARAQSRARGVLRVAATPDAGDACLLHAARADGSLETWARPDARTPFELARTASGLSPATRALFARPDGGGPGGTSKAPSRRIFFVRNEGSCS